MPIWWAVNCSCAAKRALTAQGVLDALKARGFAEEAIDAYRREKPEVPLEEITFRWATVTPEGTTTEDVRAIDLLARAEALDPYRADCRACPANVMHEPFGCHGVVNYPLSAAGELWLVGQLPASERSPLLRIALDAVRDFGYGQHFRRLRDAGRTFVERRRAVTRSWGGLLRRTSVSADSLYDMMFGVGDVQPIHGTMLCFILGAYDETGLPGYLSAGDPAALPEFRLAPEQEREQTTRQLQFFLKALDRAARLNVTVIVEA